MALGEIDVLKTLSDPLLQQMDFFVDSLHVRGSAYRKIFELIKDEQILVVEGTDPNEAHYDPQSDTIATQNVNPPPNLFNRSTLIHECTHAIKDMEHVTITALGNEAAAYLAQATYLLLSNPTEPIGPGWGVVKLAVTLAKGFNLDTDPGIQRRIKYDDIVPLVKRISQHPAYLKDQGRLSIADGISKKSRKYLDVPSPESDLNSPDKKTAQEERVPLSDSYLISLLQPRYAADDVAGYGARARKLEGVFRSASIEEAGPLFPRLALRRPGDNVSMLFHDHLSTPTRKKLLQILQDRMAGR